MSSREQSRTSIALAFVLLAFVLAGVAKWALVAGFFHGAFLWGGTILCIGTLALLIGIPDRVYEAAVCVFFGLVVLVIGLIFGILFWGWSVFLFLGVTFVFYLITSAFRLR